MSRWGRTQHESGSASFGISRLPTTASTSTRPDHRIFERDATANFQQARDCRACEETVSASDAQAFGYLNRNRRLLWKFLAQLWILPEKLAMKNLYLVSANNLTKAERTKLAAISREARPSRHYRKEFAALVRLKGKLFRRAKSSAADANAGSHRAHRVLGAAAGGASVGSSRNPLGAQGRPAGRSRSRKTMGAVGSRNAGTRSRMRRWPASVIQFSRSQTLSRADRRIVPPPGLCYQQYNSYVRQDAA
jgi:hypothetical protein